VGALTGFGSGPGSIVIVMSGDWKNEDYMCERNDCVCMDTSICLQRNICPSGEKKPKIVVDSERKRYVYLTGHLDNHVDSI